jgi:predicted RNA-binding Zn ribbon-like protein
MASSDHSKNSVEFILATSAALCLDFANTLAYRGSTQTESLHAFAELIHWCAGSIAPKLARQVRTWTDRHPKRAADAFGEAIALREVIYRIFHEIASGARPDEHDLDSLNRGLREAPSRTTVQPTVEGFGWQVEESKTSASSILAPVLWSAGDLLVGRQLSKLRECSNGKCLWLFLDDSKNGTRRWCSMQACGNRAKAHRHYVRQKRA